MGLFLKRRTIFKWSDFLRFHACFPEDMTHISIFQIDRGPKRLRNIWVCLQTGYPVTPFHPMVNDCPNTKIRSITWRLGTTFSTTTISYQIGYMISHDISHYIPMQIAIKEVYTTWNIPITKIWRQLPIWLLGSAVQTISWYVTI